jgi:mannosyltransferase OCH1-like enzyme
MTIPKILHYVWVGPKPFPARGHEFVAGWKALLPDYEFMLWDESNIDFSPSFIRRAHGVREYSRVANYARFKALTKYGGFYLDHDVELLTSLDALRDQQCVLGFQADEQNAEVNCAVMGAVPGHPFMQELVDALDRMDGSYNWGANTGPGLVTRLLRAKEAISPRDEPYHLGDITLYPPRYFYPFGWRETFTPECVTPDTMAIHHWDHSWGHTPSVSHSLKRRWRRLLTRLAPTLRSDAIRRSDLKQRRSLSAGRA